MSVPSGNSAQRPYPKQASHDAERDFQFVSCDLTGPTTHPALGLDVLDSKYVRRPEKEVEIYFSHETQKYPIESLPLYFQALVIPTALRLERPRTDKLGSLQEEEVNISCKLEQRTKREDSCQHRALVPPRF